MSKMRSLRRDYYIYFYQIVQAIEKRPTYNTYSYPKPAKPPQYFHIAK